MPRGGCLPILLGVGALLLVVLFFIFGGGGDGSDSGLGDLSDFTQQDQGGFTQEDQGGLAQQGETAGSEQSIGASPTLPPVSYQGELTTAGGSAEATPGQTWTIMLYQDADDKILEQDIFIDFNEAERVGSTDRVNVVAQLDRYRGGFSGDGNWDDTRRFYLTADRALNRINSQGQSIGEVDMSDPNQLVDFAVWAIENYPADKYVLIMSDHGMGWPGGWTDGAPSGGSGGRGIPIGRAIGDALYLHDIDAALQAIRDRTGIEAFELVGMDACLMGHAEVFAALTPHARYAVASQETEPAVGWAYASFLGDLTRNPDMNGADLSRAIVESYINQDERILDPEARAEFARGSAGQIADQLGRSVTLAAADLSQMPAVIEAMNDFAMTLQGADQRAVAKARNYAQSFTSIWGQGTAPSYIDLAHFAAILTQETGDPQIRQSVENMFAVMDRAIVAEKSGPQKPAATGVSIYFPDSKLYSSPVAGPDSYIPVARRFADVSLWDDFLRFHYTGRGFEDTSGTLAAPEAGRAITAPGAGTISLSPLRLSDDTAGPGQPVTMSADVDGENVGYIYLFAGFYDRESNSIYKADTDFIDSGDTREVNGIYYPEWGEGAFTLEFDWEPIVFAIFDGTNQVQALFEPITYGVASEEAVYAVDGLYTYADGEQRTARLLFRNGELERVIGFLGDEVDGAAREITPQPGDQFTVYEKWMDLDANGRVVGEDTEPGGTIVFGSEPIVWQVLDGPPGDYTIGFIVEDLDRNRVETYSDVSVP